MVFPAAYLALFFCVLDRRSHPGSDDAESEIEAEIATAKVEAAETGSPICDDEKKNMDMDMDMDTDMNMDKNEKDVRKGSNKLGLHQEYSRDHGSDLTFFQRVRFVASLLKFIAPLALVCELYSCIVRDLLSCATFHRVRPPIVHARRSAATGACARTFRARGGAQRRACALAAVVFRSDAMRCDAMRCDAMRCDAMRCDAMPCDAMRCHAMPCDAMRSHAMPCDAMRCHAVRYDAMPCDVLRLTPHTTTHPRLCRVLDHERTMGRPRHRQRHGQRGPHALLQVGIPLL